jgi:outer membrane protein assembly factor BamB
VVYYGGLVNPQTTYVSTTQLSFSFTFLSPPLAGSTLSLSVVDPASGDVLSNALFLSIAAAVPVTSSISPSSVYVDQGAVAVTVTGQFFTPTAVVYFNGSARPTKLNNGQLIAQLTALDVSTVGSANITVQDTASGNVASNPVTLTIQPLPNIALNSLSPGTVPAGNGAFTLTVAGNGFNNQSAVNWNGIPLTTTYVSLTVLTASVTAAQVANVGTVQVTVVNPGTAGGTSGALPVSIVAPSIDAVSYQINNGHSGSITFKSATLPSSPAWSVNVGGTPSYAVIVANRVYVMANNNGNSQLLALNGASGATIWGPTAFAGAAGITYDNGMLFINSGTFVSNGVLTAVDATTGAMKWSATIPGEFATQSPPVASEGIVYILEDGDLTAFSESSGAQLWQQNATGTNGSVAVTIDGVYTAAPCTPNDFRPLTGTVIWSSNTGCEGGGGATPVVGSGRAYAPISPGGYGGNIYDSESGAVLGAFNYSVPPAVSATQAYVMFNSTVQGIALSNNQINWSFAGDGTLVTSPIVVNNYVFVGASSGNLYGLDATTGSLLWTQNLGAGIESPATGGSALQGYSGLSAGDGLLVVPAGNTVTAYVLSTNP